MHLRFHGSPLWFLHDRLTNGLFRTARSVGSLPKKWELNSDWSPYSRSHDGDRTWVRPVGRVARLKIETRSAGKSADADEPWSPSAEIFLPPKPAVKIKTLPIAQQLGAPSTLCRMRRLMIGQAIVRSEQWRNSGRTHSKPQTVAQPARRRQPR